MKKFLNNEGFTLIELLAGVVIAFGIFGVTTSGLLNTYKHHERAQEKIQLAERANSILAELTKQHKTASSYVITYNQNAKKLLLDGRDLTPDGIELAILAGQDNYNEVNNTSITILTGLPLLIELQLKDKKNPAKYTVRTVINRY